MSRLSNGMGGVTLFLLHEKFLFELDGGKSTFPVLTESLLLLPLNYEERRALTPPNGKKEPFLEEKLLVDSPGSLLCTRKGRSYCLARRT